MSEASFNQQTGQSSSVRAILSILLPVLAAVLVSFLVSNYWNLSGASSAATTTILLSTVAVVSLLLGLRWYSLKGLGIRGGRALTAGIGFASLVWIVFLLLRIFFVFISPEALQGRPPNAGKAFIYLLLFEAFATQIWTYGLIFRSIADWRGPLTAAIVSGIIFGVTALLLFQESFAGTPSSFIYFVIWGVLYGIIRLRTGSLLGTALVQPVQTFTAWVVLAPYAMPDTAQLNMLYLSATIAYMLIAWRLWPKSESDYRV